MFIIVLNTPGTRVGPCLGDPPAPKFSSSSIHSQVKVWGPSPSIQVKAQAQVQSQVKVQAQVQAKVQAQGQAQTQVQTQAQAFH